MKNLTLFAHPTTILIVDDDPVYLRNLALALSSRWAVRTTSSPKRAIEFMRAANEPVFTLEQAYRRVFDPHRFKTPAILVADYDMPEMNGLELCDALRDASIETILLTGKADKKTAVNAFNEGLISRFLNKQTPDVLQFLTQYFSELNQDFFTRRYSYSIHETRHETDGVEFLRDRAFIKTFRTVLERENIVEYYFSMHPKGFLLLNNVGSARLMAVCGEEDLRSQREVAEDENAPEDLLKRLRERKHLSIFPDGDHHFRKGDDDSYWRGCLYRAKKIRGNQTWYWSLLPDASPYAIGNDTVLSYCDYLDQRNREGSELVS